MLLVTSGEATTGRALAYSGRWLDRAADRRTDPQWVAAVLARPGTTVLPLWRDACLVDAAHAPLVLSAAEARAALAAGELVFLGLDGASGVFALDLSALDGAAARELTGAAAALDVRRLVGRLDPALAAGLAYARGILLWHRNQRFCGACGGTTASRSGGHLRVCDSPAGCGKLLFPRIEPSVIALVEAPGGPPRCLLGRHRGAPEGAYSTLAGFVEIGESLEDAVQRELAEEAGVRLASLRYQISQAWPFPAGLMVGFRAVALSDEVAPDHDELEQARWFTRAEVRELIAQRGQPGLFNADSIERCLIDAWLEEGD